MRDLPDPAAELPTVLVDVTITEFDGGRESNKVTVRSQRVSGDYLATAERVLHAVAGPAVPAVSGVVPSRRTHSVRSVVMAMDGSDVLMCRGCGEQWPASEDAEALERLACGTRRDGDDDE